MKVYLKKDIDKIMNINENKNVKIFNKRDLMLKENNNGNAYVEGSNDNSSSLSSDLSKAKSNNPNDTEFIVNANSYDGNSSNNTVTLDVTGNSPSDASKNFQKLTKQPSVRNLMNTTNVNAKVHLRNESIEKMKEEAIPFTKKELNNLLKK